MIAGFCGGVFRSRNDASDGMTAPALSLHPRLADTATPLSLIRTYAGEAGIYDELGVDAEQWYPVGEAILSARLEVPPGEWLVWVDAAWALWIGARVDALPRAVRVRLEEGDPDDLIVLINALADVGVWLREAALLIDDGWTPSRRGDGVFAEIATLVVAAISGIFVDRTGRSARLEVRSGAFAGLTVRPWRLNGSLRQSICPLPYESAHQPGWTRSE